MNAPHPDAMISVDRLCKRYGAFAAVENLSLDIWPNEIFGLLGPNGAGKTTTISMVCGLLPPSSGSISFRGQKRQDPRGLIGYCPQENIFYPKLTCLEQLLFIGQLYGISISVLKIRAMELLEGLGLSEKAHARADSLSGGMKRRLNICLALIHDPEVLVLDEPEAGLDPQSRMLVREFIRAFGRRKTVLLTTHNMDEADRLADRIAIMDHGKLLLLDTPTALKKTVGEGDLLEISTDSSAGEVHNCIKVLEAHAFLVKDHGNRLLVKHPEMLAKLPEIKMLAEMNGLNITEIRLRENTLEDVFIHLTDKTLRP